MQLGGKKDIGHCPGIAIEIAMHETKIRNLKTCFPSLILDEPFYFKKQSPEQIIIYLTDFFTIKNWCDKLKYNNKLHQ